MKLFWVNYKQVGKDREWEFGCLWPFFVALAVVAALIVWAVL